MSWTKTEFRVGKITRFMEKSALFYFAISLASLSDLFINFSTSFDKNTVLQSLTGTSANLVILITPAIIFIAINGFFALYLHGTKHYKYDRLTLTPLSPEAIRPGLNKSVDQLPLREKGKPMLNISDDEFRKLLRDPNFQNKVVAARTERESRNATLRNPEDDAPSDETMLMEFLSQKRRITRSGE